MGRQQRSAGRTPADFLGASPAKSPGSRWAGYEAFERLSDGTPQPAVVLADTWRMGRRFLAEWAYGRVIVTELGRTGLIGGPALCVADRISRTDAMLSGEAAMSKWLSKAVRKAVKRTEAGPAGDAGFLDGLPALAEFMRLMATDAGEAREPSALMIAMGEGDVRVGLKDDDAGGWLWRSGETLRESLEAIEKALQAGTAVFRSANRPKRK